MIRCMAMAAGWDGCHWDDPLLLGIDDADLCAYEKEYKNTTLLIFGRSALSLSVIRFEKNRLPYREAVFLCKKANYKKEKQQCIR